jgi:sugar phosphate isomerase/epimerase
MRDLSADQRYLSINTATLRGQWNLEQIIEGVARHGIPTVSPWRDQVKAIGLEHTAMLLEDHGLSLSGYCRGGMFTSIDEAGASRADDDNRRAVDEAVTLAAPCLVLVVGALPGALDGKPLSRDIGLARQQVEDGIGRLLEYARSCNMPLAIEPLHPMYAADRACVNTLSQALDLCDTLDPAASGALGVAVDVYHVWWDPLLHAGIRRAGAKRLLALHICDWLTPTTDLLNDRGMMGDGVIELKKIRGWMEEAGFAGATEVEIFSQNNWWKRPADEVLATCIERYQTVV